MKNQLALYQTITAVSFAILYIDDDKISWFMFFYLPILSFLTGTGAAQPILEIGNVMVLNALLSTIYLMIVMFSGGYLFWRGIKGMCANRLSIIACLFLFSIVLLIMNKSTFGNAFSIIGLLIFAIFGSLSIVSNFMAIRINKH
ncbi:hypothetical protein ABIE26_003218 [Pedobacter africanus]|uniref:Uncharacterized protein n=1 Tax=Pedobacter africanus TaxID=151894 RepID=A0ACC6KYW9_9SPHI|nr:hypothetical protein [Pedobacter africanus]MDR6784573.1 hypothetical protein [Pedobacter africanus]